MTRFPRPGSRPEPLRLLPGAARAALRGRRAARWLTARVLAIVTLTAGLVMMPATISWAAPRAAGTAAAPVTAGSPATAAARAAASPGDPFCIPPSPLPAGKPGSVIRYRPAPAPLPATQAWDVLYLARGWAVAITDCPGLGSC